MMRTVRQVVSIGYAKTWVFYAGCGHRVLYDASAANYTLPEKNAYAPCPACAVVEWEAMEIGEEYRLYFRVPPYQATIGKLVRHLADGALFRFAGKVRFVPFKDVHEARKIHT